HETATYAGTTLSLPPGATLALYTDGLVESRTTSLDVGLSRLAALPSHAGRGALESLADQLLACAPGGEDADDRTLLLLAIVENVQRADLSPLDEAEGYRRLIDEFGYTQQDVADSVGRERSTVANLLRLLQLPASVQRLVSAGSLSMGHARAILGLGDERRMADLARRAAEEGLSVRAVEEEVRRKRAAEPQTSKSTPKTAARADAHVRHLETELQRRLGTAVRIHVTRGNAGRIDIPFHGGEDFERLLELLLDRKERGW
ncbi:MAG: ParB/RepB/Spo0J family partition protein, partial [Gemmatimonadetes bacterium]|nr:ParB/RepB/Spo0J family partition protein [Gemmatimonadota bacterium]